MSLLQTNHRTFHYKMKINFVAGIIIFLWNHYLKCQKSGFDSCLYNDVIFYHIHPCSSISTLSYLGKLKNSGLGQIGKFFWGRGGGSRNQGPSGSQSYTFMLITMALFVREGAKCPNDSLGSLKSSFSFLCVSLRWSWV